MASVCIGRPPSLRPRAGLPLGRRESVLTQKLGCAFVPDVIGVDSSVPKVSVVVPTHGRPDLLRQTIAAIVGQDFAGVVECIVVHDGEPADQDLASDDSRRPVIVIENTHIRGLTGVRNSGLAVATGEVIGWCDDDDVWYPNKLTRQIALLEATPGALAVGSSHRWLAPDGSTAIHAAPKSAVSQRDVLLYAGAAMGLHSSTILVRRTVYDRVGGYDETLPQSRLEDLEFFLRLTSLGPVPVGREALADIRVNPFSPFSRERRRTMAEAGQIILSRYHDFDAVPAARATMYRRIAANYSAAGEHALARRWAFKALRIRARDPRAATIVACSMARIEVTSVYAIVRRMRRLGGGAPVNPTLRGAI